MEKLSMAHPAPSRGDVSDSGDLSVLEPEQRELILSELERILHGKRFQNSGRAKQFLSFIVERKLDGHSDDLKERTIGTELFHRSPSYSTGDDPVVRVQAGLVRRKLEQHYQDVKTSSPVRIELPLGSYAPEFQWQNAEQVETLAESAPSEQVPETVPAPASRFPKRLILIVGLAVAAVLIIVAIFARVKLGQTAQQKSASEQFWAPALATQKPVLFCLSNAPNYHPRRSLYERYRSRHPGAFTTITERDNDPLPLDPSEKITFGDMELFYEWGITRGDLETAVKLAAFFGKIGKPIDLRVESEYTFRDLRDSPAVLIGAFNNEWTMNLVSDLKFAFVEKEGIRIEEKGSPARYWPQLPDQPFSKEDYAIISRLNDPKTGQYTFIVAGLTSRGTEAAAEFLSNESDLGKFLSTAPKNWQSKNLELVLKTEVTDGVSGPPQVVASNFW